MVTTENLLLYVYVKSFISHLGWSHRGQHLTTFQLSLPDQEMAKYRSKGDLGARTEIERDNTEHVLDHQSRVRVSIRSTAAEEGRVGALTGERERCEAKRSQAKPSEAM